MTWLGLRYGGGIGGWLGLTAGILLTAALAWRVADRMLRGQSGRFTAGMWLAYCALCVFGYLAGGWLGLLTITLPSLILFWIGLYRLSAYTLPLEDRRKQRGQAFRSLLTYTMGTNYPYYVLRHGKLEERVPGNAFLHFFAGPGIVIAHCDQAGYRSTGVNVLGIAEPGVTFTGKFELPPKVVDLRPQLCAFYVDALTKDGIPIRVLAFAPFSIQRGKQEPELGKPFPFRRRAIYEAVAREPVERGKTEEDTHEHQWNVDLVPMKGRRIVQDIISQYRVDELCAADDLARDPRIEIISQYEAELVKAMLPYGIEIMGGGLSNLEPTDDTILERRIENWRTEWVREMLVDLAKGDAERVRQIENARAEAEEHVVLKLAGVVEECMADEDSTEAALALRFIDCLGEMVSETENQWPPPKALESTLDQLRGKLTVESQSANERT
jgi:hypothetical protein